MTNLIKKHDTNIIGKPEENMAAVPVPPYYIVIIPARNEEKYIGATLESLVGQMCAPLVILVVDDGSTDSTSDIVKQYAREHPSVKLFIRSNRGYRFTGPGVIEAFYEGIESLGDCNYDYLAKLDADCEFPPDYFSRILAEFQRNPKLGICGGMLYDRTEKGLKRNWHPVHHIRGATKIYRRSCFVDIGGLERLLGWDVLDELTARFKGWQAYTIESLPFVTNRKAGEPIGFWKRWTNAGRIAYMLHSSFIYLLAKAIRRCINKPYILGGLLIMVGYFISWWQQNPRIGDRKLIRFIQHEQRLYLWKALTFRAK
jgi:glycosyltransferase involved in cell wall biosynthesis